MTIEDIRADFALLDGGYLTHTVGRVHGLVADLEIGLRHAALRRIDAVHEGIPDALGQDLRIVTSITLSSQAFR